MIKQFSKFVIVGFINTAIDFAILNALMFSTNIYSGKWIIAFNSISFSIAIANSYFMNKRWTFTSSVSQKSAPKQFSQFLIISVIGVLINDSLVYSISAFIPPLFGLSEKLWVNIAKAAATGVSMFWNFAGYKFIVFQK